MACLLAVDHHFDGDCTGNRATCRSDCLVLYQRRRCQSGGKELLWLNAFFMPIWAMAWTLPCAFKGARDVRYTMWVSMLGMWGCRVVAGYTLGIVLGMGVIGVWLGMVLDWAVRGVLLLPNG